MIRPSTGCTSRGRSPVRTSCGGSASTRASRSADEIERGPLRVLFVLGGNPLTAVPDADRTRAALESLDALIVLDVATSALTELATHVLPVTGQLERGDISMLENVAYSNGTQHTSAVVRPGAERRPAWWVLGSLARRLDLDVLGGVEPDDCSDDQVLRGISAGSRGGYDEIVAGGPHGVRNESRYGWVHDVVLPRGQWRIAPRSLLARLASSAAGAERAAGPRSCSSRVAGCGP